MWYLEMNYIGMGRELLTLELVCLLSFILAISVAVLVVMPSAAIGALLSPSVGREVVRETLLFSLVDAIPLLSASFISP